MEHCSELATVSGMHAKIFGDTILSGTNNGMTDQELMDKLVNGITASTIK